jgi:hypothetical protein
MWKFLDSHESYSPLSEITLIILFFSLSKQVQFELKKGQQIREANVLTGT